MHRLLSVGNLEHAGACSALVTYIMSQNLFSSARAREGERKEGLGSDMYFKLISGRY